jgi:hypothetical protein
VILLIQLRSPAGRPIARVRVSVDARLRPDAKVGPPRPLTSEAPGEILEEREVRLDLSGSAGLEVVVEVAAAADDQEGPPAAVRLRVERPTVLAGPTTRLPRLNAVVIGVSAYRADHLRKGVTLATKDARDLETALRRQEKRLYREVNVQPLRDAEVTREAVNRALQWLATETTDRDTAVVFIAGHGVTNSDGDFFFLPPEATESDAEARGIPADDIKRPLRRMAGRVLVFLDTCYAGALVTDRTRSPNMNHVVNDLLSARRGLLVYSATTENTRAQELPGLENGVFTHALLRGLSGAASQPPTPADGVVRVNWLADVIAEEVKRLTGGQQRATFSVPQHGGPADPLFLVTR